MTEVSIETVAGKLNRIGYEAFLQSLRLAKSAGNRNAEIAHLLFILLQGERTDIALTFEAAKLDRGRLQRDLATKIEGYRKNATESPGISEGFIELLDRGWHYATLMFGETQIRTGHLLAGALMTERLNRDLMALSPAFKVLNPDLVARDGRTLWRQSDEEQLRPFDGSGLSQAPGGAAAATAPGSGAATALSRYSQDLTARAREGKMDPVLGRDDEIRQLIDVLMRRRQNNPILTGEAGVGKTAVVEGFAQRIVAGEVPPALSGVRLCALDIGLMQAGASMKGEFEQRLRSVIDEVQSSPDPIILFIDEAHTLIGAGGAQGTGDAANLLKPALARGTLRTIAATTWSEYRQYIEKDPALTRRFQPVQVDEPSPETAAFMLRGVLAPMEKHHGVRISDAAVKAAVNLSHRYIPARQLPDKAVSLLDTAAARVAVSQSTKPAAIEDLEARIAALGKEREAKQREADIGKADVGRIADIDAAVATATGELEALKAEYDKEQAIVREIVALRQRIAEDGEGAADLGGRLIEEVATLEAIPADRRMVYPFVDEQAVASVVADWTGIPVGRMVADEVETILNLPAILARRVVGQDHGLEMIARRIETSRAKLDNPDKPIGVFMLCGPSGVGKTETALTLAETLYGGEQNLITINMSEFQEAHSVSLLKGAPPGYVGYGEGGRLTEAVRRKPYSVVLLDEVEKAHPDVHEIFFQVFDKGMMEDGNGRRIDFKNTLIILTSNVGTEAIMHLAAAGSTRPSQQELDAALRPYLTAVFPPALLGRIVTIPYYPLSRDMLAGIVRLQLGRIGKRIALNHDATFAYDDTVVDHIVERCDNPDSGGRMIDNIITNTLLPDLARAFLKRTLEKAAISAVRVEMGEGGFAYRVE